MKIKLALIALVTVLFISCNATQPAVAGVEGKMWKLKTFEGKDMTDLKLDRTVFFMLNKENNRVSGFSGCNNMLGTYTLEKGNRIKFSQMASTMMACTDHNFNESAFLEVFELADNYTISGTELSINVGRRAPLAVFEAVDAIK
ncbi:META domain-containing protein [Flavobacterium tegetincola]|uniref:META domain-containing protein n=1 Tax=Flavobacterium tegetincola TaxID=150172 RepID=UPI00041470B9|nr:META domain-containing protein [Flavobacterium tegetincola]